MESMSLMFELSAALLLARLGLASVFLYAGIAKLCDLSGTREMLHEFGVPQAATRLLAWLLPIGELSAAAALIPSATASWGASAATGLLIVFTAAAWISIRRGNRPACRCFGQLDAKPIGASTIARNLMLLCGALFVLAAAREQADSTVLSGLGSHFALLVAAGSIAGILAVQTFLMLQILRQQGRMLLRLDALSPFPSEEFAYQNGSVHEPAAQGLPVRTVAPAFELPLLDGGRVTLEHLLGLGKRVVLLFAHPGCGPCKALLPEIARWHQESPGKFTFAMISEGSIRENQQFVAGYKLPYVAIQKDLLVSNAFAAYGTPAALIIEPDGRVGTPVAGGAQQIYQLLESSEESLKVGDSVLELSGLTERGNELRLATLKGHDLGLVFWDALCGYCKAAVDDLVAIDRRIGAHLLIVSSAPDEGLIERCVQAMFVIDKDRRWARLVGATGTPMAVRIDAEGNIASSVAAGKDEVMRLLESIASLNNPAGREPKRRSSLQGVEAAPA